MNPAHLSRVATPMRPTGRSLPVYADRVNSDPAEEGSGRMALVSMIIPHRSETAGIDDRLNNLHDVAERAGHRVEILVSGHRAEGAPRPTFAHARWVDSQLPDLGPAVVAGLHAAKGEFLIVLDLDRPYSVGDVERVLACLADSGASLVVASRYGATSSAWRRLLGRLLKRIAGTSDPLSGLIGLTRAAFLDAADRFSVVGSKFSLELLAKVHGRWRDVPVDLSRHRRLPRLGWDDVRHLKRLADHRFGTISRLIQFCFVGASGMLVDLASYAGFQKLFADTPLANHSAPFLGQLNLAVSGILAVSVALVWNFTLNRRLTFSDARSGRVIRQFLTYALSNAVSVPLSLMLRLQLPQRATFFAEHKLAAALVGIIAGTALSFSMARWLVFRSTPTPTPSDEPLAPASEAEDYVDPNAAPPQTAPAPSSPDLINRPSWFSA